MSRGLLKVATSAVVGILSAVGAAQAGGLERNGYNIDLLFDPGPFAFGSAFTYVSPNRKLKNTKDLTGYGIDGRGGGDTSADETPGYLVPYFGAKINVIGPVDCLFDYSQPWGAHTNPGANWAGARSNIETEVKSDNFGATCSYKFDVGRGDLRVIGGAFWQDVYGFKDRLVVAPIAPGLTLQGTGHLHLEGDGYGWRGGLAYEIPEIALRTSLVYNSEVKLNSITGTVDLTSLPNIGAPLLGQITDVHGSATMPQSLEFKAQTGIAPDWLAYGSVKWVDWSVLQSIPFFTANEVKATSLDLYYQDGWTVSGGLGHKFTDVISGALGVTWDRGVSQGYGDLSDTWTLNGGVSFTPRQNVSFIAGGAVGVMTSGSSNGKYDGVTYDYGNDFVGAVTLAAKVTF